MDYFHTVKHGIKKIKQINPYTAMFFIITEKVWIRHGNDGKISILATTREATMIAFYICKDRNNREFIARFSEIFQSPHIDKDVTVSFKAIRFISLLTR
jgi:hypothetical protein